MRNKCGQRLKARKEYIRFICNGFDNAASNLLSIKGKGKCKVHPRTGHEGPGREVRYSYTLSLTSALDGGGWATPCPGRFTPGKDPVPIVWEAGWTPGPVWTGAENLAPLPPPPFDPRTVQSRYTD